MTGKNEDFWQEMLEDGADGQHMASQLQDQASQRAVQAVRDLYRIDEDDQQSVQRAWARLTQRVQATAVEQDVSVRLKTPEMGLLFKRPGEGGKPTLQRRWALLVACITAFLLLGSFVSLLVVLPGQGARTGTTAPTRQGTQITTQLGTHLGDIALGESLDDVVALLRPAQPDTKGIAFPDSKLISLKYTKIGVQIFYDSDSHVMQIAVWAPFNGATAEHFAPGMSFSQFTHIYPQAPLMQSDEIVFYQKTFLPFSQKIASGALVDDGHGTRLLVFFDANQVALLLVLQSKK